VHDAAYDLAKMGHLKSQYKTAINLLKQPSCRKWICDITGSVQLSVKSFKQKLNSNQDQEYIYHSAPINIYYILVAILL